MSSFPLKIKKKKNYERKICVCHFQHYPSLYRMMAGRCHYFSREAFLVSQAVDGDRDGNRGCRGGTQSRALPMSA